MRPFRTKAVLFDFDGTLTKPDALDFAEIGRAVGSHGRVPVLEFIESIADPVARSEAHAVLERFELAAAAESLPNEAAERTVANLRSSGLSLGVITRNALVSVERALENFDGLSAADFDLIMTRDLPLAPKPAPDGILEAARLLGVEAPEVMIVGDYVLDIEAGARAGAVTVLLENGVSGRFADVAADFRISSLDELPGVVRLGLPLPEGKLPNDLLATFLSDLARASRDNSVLVGPAVGEDAAVVSVAAGEAVVLKSDPITFATTELSAYALQVNANDVVSLGGIPRWYQATLLFPPGSTPSAVLSVMEGIREACARQGIALTGGHTEITSAVSRAVVAGSLVGTVSPGSVLRKSDVSPGDRIVLTKRLAVEGTALLARELAPELLAAGMNGDDLERCRALLDRISVAPEAQVALDSGAAIALHDITEGGLATAMTELSAAVGLAVRVFPDRVPLYPETEEVCHLLGLDPFGLIASGSLLIACRPERADTLVRDLATANVEAAVIGVVLEEPSGPLGSVRALRGSESVPWPTFLVDEAARALAGRTAEKKS